MTQNIQEILDWLEKADAVKVDFGPVLTDWTIDDPCGEDDNEVCYFSWTNGDQDYSIILTEEGIKNGSFNSLGDFTCEDHEGEETIIETYSLLKRLQPE